MAFRSYQVNVKIRRGMGPDTFEKPFSVGLDDLPDDISDYEAESMARREVESRLYASEDYPLYGKNWWIMGVYRT